MAEKGTSPRGTMVQVPVRVENATPRAVQGRQAPREEEGEWIPRQLEAKLKTLRGDVTRWALVPKPFLLLVTFCVSFALVSLIALLIMATTPTEPASDTSSSADASDDYDKESSNVMLGVGVVSSIIGSLQTASGYCAQRLSHQITAVLGRRQRPRSSEGESKNHPLFYVGLLLLVCGTISAIVNLGILGQSVTAPFAAMTLIFNGCLAFTVLHEAVTKYDIIATALVLSGVGLAMFGVAMAHLDAQAFTLSDIETIFTRSAFPALYSVCVLSTLFTSFLIIKKRNLQAKPAGLCCFSIGAGLLSGFSSLCVKCTVEVVKGVTQHQSGDLSNPVLYVFVMGIPVCVLSQLKLMTLGLQHFGTLKFVPPYHAFIILSNLINGMVYFDEASGYDALSACLFAAGCAVTISGVFVLLAKVPQRVTDGQDPAARGATSPNAKKLAEIARSVDVSTDSTSSSSEGDVDMASVVVAAPRSPPSLCGDLHV